MAIRLGKCASSTGLTKLQTSLDAEPCYVDFDTGNVGKDYTSDEFYIMPGIWKWKFTVNWLNWPGNVAADRPTMQSFMCGLAMPPYEDIYIADSDQLVAAYWPSVKAGTNGFSDWQGININAGPTYIAETNFAGNWIWPPDAIGGWGWPIDSLRPLWKDNFTEFDTNWGCQNCLANVPVKFWIRAAVKIAQGPDTYQMQIRNYYPFRVYVQGWWLG